MSGMHRLQSDHVHLDLLSVMKLMAKCSFGTRILNLRLISPTLADLWLLLALKVIVFLPGNIAWPIGVFLKYTSGDQLGPINMVSVKPLGAGEEYDLSVNMISPGKTGMYQGQWRMCTPTGQYFGGE